MRGRHDQSAHTPGGANPPGVSVSGPPHPGIAYRPEIDCLRAIAVLAVVLYHAAPEWLPGGFVGVDVFFVLSGYLITRLLADEKTRTGRIDYLAFYARRVRRLFPAMAVVTVIVALAAWWLLGRHGSVYRQTGESAAASLLFAANVYFPSQLGAYFDGPAERMPLLHLWSLAVEEQFYLVYPALLALLWRLIPGGVARWLAIIAVGSLGLAEYWVHIQPERAFYLMPARFWELAAGALLALSPARPARRTGTGLAAATGLLLVLLAAWLTPRLGYFPASAALPAVAGTVLVLWAIHRDADGRGPLRWLQWRPLVSIGLVSYSLYLWHWPLLAFDANLRLDPAPVAWRLLLCLLALGLAWASWRWVEQPFRRSRARPGRIVLAGIAASLLLAGGMFALSRADRVPEATARQAERAAQDFAPGMRQCHFDVDDEVTALKPPACRSDPGRAPRVVVWGDSQGWAWKPFAWALADARGESAMAITMNSCPPTGLAMDNVPPLPSAGCRRLNELASASLADGRAALVVLALRWPAGGAGPGPVPAAIADRIRGIEAIIERVGPATPVLVIGPTPLMRRPAPECLSLGWESRCAQPRAEFDQRSARVRAELSSLQARHGNVVVVDPTLYFCDAAKCPVARDGHALYWDGNHVSASAAAAFAARFIADPAGYTLREPAGAAPEARNDP